MAELPPRYMLRPPQWVPRARRLFDRPYDPHDEHPDVKPDPEDKQRYLRRSLLGASAVHTTLNPRDYLAMAERHLAVLEAHGVHSPQREYHIDKNNPFRPRTAVLYTSVAKVDGEQLVGMDEERKKALGRVLFEAIHAYFKWVRSNERYMLGDLIFFKQYLWGTQPGDTAKKLYLVDIDPHLLSLINERDEGYVLREVAMYAQLATYAGLDAKSLLMHDWLA